MDNDTYYAAFQYKKKGVYTIVVLDQWNFYKDRIQSTKSHLPDQIIVFDNDAKIVRKLFSRLKIIVLQNPYLNEIVNNIIKIKHNRDRNKLFYIALSNKKESLHLNNHMIIIDIMNSKL